jgi:hypothetical protein
MIAFRSNNDSEDLSKKLQKLIDAINAQPLDEYQEGSLHQQITLLEINDAIYNTLFEEACDSIQLTIYKNPNNSMDMIINKIEDGY